MAPKHSRFRVAANAPVPVEGASSTAQPVLTSLQALSTMASLPVVPVSTQGRVIFVFGTSNKYPAEKYILAETPTDTGSVKVVVKVSAPSGLRIELDSVIQLGRVEVRRAWRRANGSLPEGDVIEGLCPFEIAVNLFGSGDKRKRGAE